MVCERLVFKPTHPTVDKDVFRKANRAILSRADMHIPLINKIYFRIKPVKFLEVKEIKLNDEIYTFYCIIFNDHSTTG